MKKLISALFATLVFTSVAQALPQGYIVLGDDQDPIEGYSGEYKYPTTVSYVDFRGNYVTGKGWIYVTVADPTLSGCQATLLSASSWGAVITKGCSPI